MHMGSISKKGGAIINKNLKNARKLKAHSFTAQTHGYDGSGSN